MYPLPHESSNISCNMGFYVFKATVPLATKWLYDACDCVMITQTCTCWPELGKQQRRRLRCHNNAAPRSATCERSSGGGWNVLTTQHRPIASIFWSQPSSQALEFYFGQAPNPRIVADAASKSSPVGLRLKAIWKWQQSWFYHSTSVHSLMSCHYKCVSVIERICVCIYTCICTCYIYIYIYIYI